MARTIRSTARRMGAGVPGALPPDPLWYKSAIIYELHVRSFADSNGDGIGDFPGLTGKLDYLQDLGVTAIWLLPFYPSPLRDDGYDIADYTAINPAYGTMRDFRRFVAEAHARGLRVITELVVNHTSDQHPWFQRARRSPPGSRWRNFYVWSDDPGKYAGTRVIFQDFEASNWAWDRVAGAYYWHRFYAHQPDLNFENPEVHRAIEEVVDHWFGMGVDGMRLDAIPYLYEREGTNCENLPETHEYLKQLRRYVDKRHADKMLLAEANQWPEDAVAYFGDGDECHMSFHFPLMPRLFMAIRMEDRFPVIDILQQTPPIPATAQWALFLRNHDELTLEMVTDEERDYMYRAYAMDRQARINLGIRRRLAPLLGNNRRKVELMNGLLLSLPGTPVIYYGDEIGMGDNVYLGDRNGVRTPMQWSADRNAGFSRANPQRLFLPVIIDPEYHYETVNVEAQQNNPSSLMWWMKRLIALRKRHPVFGNGGIEFLHPANARVLAYLRSPAEGGEGQSILVVANLSRFVQCAELDLGRFRGARPVELFGATPLPPIGDRPYFLTLGPHSFYWFSLERPSPAAAAGGDGEPARRMPQMKPGFDWDLVAGSRSARAALEEALLQFIPGRRWFGGKARSVRGLRLVEVIRLRTESEAGGVDGVLAIGRIEYAEGEPELYVLPLAMGSAERVQELLGLSSPMIVAEAPTRDGSVSRYVYDGMSDPVFCRALLDAIARRRRVRGEAGELAATPTAAFRRVLPADAPVPQPTISSAEQSNSSALFGDRVILKVFRRAEPGINPEVEIGRVLTERARFEHASPLAGWMAYVPDGGEPVAIGVVHGYVPNEGDAWRLALDRVGQYFERAIAKHRGGSPPPGLPGASVLELALDPMPAEVVDLVGHNLELAELLGRRTGELHRALADPSDPAFAPEPLGQLSLRSLYQSVRNSVRRSVDLLRKRADMVPEPLKGVAADVLSREGDLLARLKRVTLRRLGGARIRCHGDYHLGQVLFTGKDFVIIDFEGEPAKPLGERRLKWTPIRDVAGMIRSFHYAAQVGLMQQAERGAFEPGEEERRPLEPWAAFWTVWVSASFLRGYLRATEGSGLLPSDLEELRMLLDVWLIEKTAYELAYELNNRPSWLYIPLLGLQQLLETPA